MSDFEGIGAYQRYRRRDDESWEVYDAGGSDGKTSGEFIVGWGSVVSVPAPRSTPSACGTELIASVHAQLQNKLSNARLSHRPPRGQLKFEDLDVMEVPALSSFSAGNVLWWGAEEYLGKEAKSLWRRVDRSKLNDRTIVPACPGAPGCRAEWTAHTQEVVDMYNDGTLPEHFILVGKWPEQDQADALSIFPGLRRISRQYTPLLGVQHACEHNHYEHHAHHVLP